MSRLSLKPHPQVGARPGTLLIPEGAPAPQLHVIRLDGEVAPDVQVGDVSYLKSILDSEGRYWIEVRGRGDERLLRDLAAMLHIHPMALEDAVNAPQRPKSELHKDHILAIARTAIEESDGELSFPQVCVFVATHHVVTFQERHLGVLDSVRERARDPTSRIRQLGPDYLGYAILDALIDRFYPVVEAFGRELDDLEEVVSTRPHTKELMKIQHLRRSIVELRRIAWAQREMIHGMLHEDVRFVSDEVRVFLRDSHDHTAQIAEIVDSLREMTASLMDIYLSVVGQRTNEVMKVLTIMSSIFVPLTFMAGIYGMNFQHMPELKSPYGYPILLSIMATSAVGLLLYFRAKGWIDERGKGPPSGA